VLIFDVFSGCFLEGFWKGFGVILAYFVLPKRRRQGKGSICANACFMYVILSFSEVIGSIWGARKIEERCKKSSWIQTQISHDFEAIAMIWGGVGERFGVRFGAEILVKFM
jgi:hypothetical protein